MKYSNECPKCFSNEIIEILGSRYNASSVIYLNKWNTKYVMIDRYLCSRCGFVEEYSRMDEKSKKNLQEIREDQLKNNKDGFV